MRVGRYTAKGRRVWRFENLEARIALSVTGPADFVVDYIDAAANDAARIGPVDATWLARQATVDLSDPAATIRSEYGLTGAGQTVAVIDSGIAWDHIALGGGYGTGYRVVGGWDFTAENDADPYDDGPLGSHGTHVAGIIAADSAQVKGIAPGVDLVGLRVFDDNGAGYFEWVEQALQWVHDNRNTLANPITTVNLSLGTNDNTDQPPNWAMLEDELAQLNADNIFVAVAAGNAFATFQQPGLSYPASSDYVVPVMALDADGGLSDFSQRSARAIAAPGRWVTSSVPDYVGDQNGLQDDFARYSGTSMASPYVAGASVLVREAMTRAGESDVAPSAIYAVIQATADNVFDPITGQFYQRIDVAAAVASVMPEDPDDGVLSVSEAARIFTDLGPVDALQLTGLRFTQPSTWYRVEAVRAGLLTVEARLASTGGDLTLELYDVDFTQVASSVTRSGRERIDLAVYTGDAYYIRAIGRNDSVDLRIVNLVSPSDTTVQVFGTAGDDTFQFTPGSRPQVTVNGLRYEFSSTQFAAFTFDGGTGKDWASLVGTKGNDIAVLRPGAVELSGAGYRVAASNVEIVSVNGRRGKDIAYLYDSTGADTFVGKPALAKLYGAGFHNLVTQFERVYGYASDGYDKAYLYDSAGDDLFHAETGFAKLYGRGFHNYARGFDRVYGYASNGYDKAYLYDSAGNDTLYAEATFAKLYGRGFHNYAAQFDRVYAYASDGNDRADLFDSPGNDIFQVVGPVSKLYGIGFHNYAHGFDRVSAFAREGNNRAIFEGLGADDLIYGRDSVARLRRPTSSEVAYGFNRITAAARNGDQARFDVQQVDYIFQQLGS